ncbi:MAG: hypothetical protein ACRC3A_01905, partial [Culicoidibacterales bacterium]
WLSLRNCLIALASLHIIAAIFVNFILVNIPVFLGFISLLLVSISFVLLVIVTLFQALYDSKKAIFACFSFYFLILIGIVTATIFNASSQGLFITSLLVTAPYTGFIGALGLFSSSPFIQLVPFITLLGFSLFTWWISERAKAK